MVLFLNGKLKFATVLFFFAAITGAASSALASDVVVRIYDYETEVLYDKDRKIFLTQDGQPVDGLVVWDTDGYRRETAIRKGFKHGLERAWYRKILIAEKQYKNGRMYGQSRAYDYNGRLIRERRHPDRERKLPGWVRSYNKQGRPVLECLFSASAKLLGNGCTKWDYLDDGITLKSEEPLNLKWRCSSALTFIYDPQGNIVSETPCTEPNPWHGISWEVLY